MLDPAQTRWFFWFHQAWVVLHTQANKVWPIASNPIQVIKIYMRLDVLQFNLSLSDHCGQKPSSIFSLLVNWIGALTTGPTSFHHNCNGQISSFMQYIHYAPVSSFCNNDSHITYFVPIIPLLPPPKVLQNGLSFHPAYNSACTAWRFYGGEINWLCKWGCNCCW